MTDLVNHDAILNTLNEYYTRNRYFDFLSILNRKNSDISLRLADWFVSNFSKKFNTRVRAKDGSVLNVYIAYKNALKSYSKRQFDPFNRRTRIEFDKFGIKIITTIGQLNFFKFAIETGIVEYIREHREVIETDMIDAIKNTRSITAREIPQQQQRGGSSNHHTSTTTLQLKKRPSKRGPLSVCASRYFTCSVENVVVVFD